MKRELWKICEEITGKNNWYEKVFDDEIVKKWKEEVGNEMVDEFVLAIKLLQGTSQGIILDKDCDIENYECEKCDSEDYWDGLCKHKKCNCVEPDFNIGKYVKYIPNNFIDKRLHDELQKGVYELKESNCEDYHPGSDGTVRDIIHPSLFCYVKGETQDVDGLVEDECEERLRYQWLPSEFEVGNEGKVRIKSYINNLDERNKNLMTNIAELFENFVPSLGQIMGGKNLCGTKMQVIVKISENKLSTSKDTAENGSWHLEGMPYEHIVATCIYYLNVKNITDSYLEFRKPVIINENSVNYPQNDFYYTRKHFGVVDHHDGFMNRYLGLIKCSETSAVIFPNNIQHRVKKFSIANKKKSNKRTIIAFFVIDPNYKIISTKKIPKQQRIISLEQAKQNRERLMFHRKYFVDQINKKVFERAYSLCEH